MQAHGGAIRTLREIRGISQAELARRVGVTRFLINNIEADRRWGTDDLLHRIAEELRVPVTAVATGPYTDAGRNLLATREAAR